MRPTLLVALAVAAALCSAEAQTTADCDRSVKHCTTCRYQFYRGTVTKAVCTKCDMGYIVKNSGRSCYCAPGYFTTGDTSASSAIGFTCEKCRVGAWCPGAKITADSSKARTECGAYKITTSDYSKSERECVVLPGFGWGAGDASAACSIGYYNPGYNTRKCTKCPGSLTTAATNSNSSQDCLAGVGFYYMRGKAVACARGTYKETIANVDCDSCPTGTTTPDGTVHAPSKKNCTVLLPGYEITMSSGGVGVTAATECGQDSYRAGESNTLDDTAGTTVACRPCGLNMVTLPNVTKATTPDACLAPPGYGWTAGGVDGQGNATVCPRGWYNPGYNREPCVPCGYGTLSTDAPGSTSADDCYTPAGHGNRRDAITGVMEAFVCPNNTYGRPTNSYGLVDVECTKCMDHTHTNTEASTSADDCLTDAGYGWDDGSINPCDYGTWNSGENQLPCFKCGDGYNTSLTNGAFDGMTQAVSQTQCRIDFGYHNGTSNAIEPCLRGFFKDTIGSQSCTQCPAGTTTTMILAAVNITDCDTCRPGFGVAGGHINVTDKTANIGCTICDSGSYSAGYTSGGEECLTCPKTQNFTGNMVSRRGVTTPEDCYGQFITDSSNPQSFLSWDYIPMSDLVYKSLIGSMADCQDLCGADVTCQYFSWYATGAANGTNGENACYWRTTGATIEGVRIAGDGTAAWWDNPADPMVLLEIREGTYVAYPKTAGETIGNTITMSGVSNTNFKAMRTACDKLASCVGLTHDVGGTWRAFSAMLRQDVVSKVRVVGRAINSWVGEPTGLELLEGWTR